MTDLVLTDDEAVAIGIDFDRPWRTALPTVSMDDLNELRAASFRGHRSLAARGLLTDGGAFDPPMSALCSMALTTDAFITVYLADDAYLLAGWGVMSGHYPASDGWVFESVNPVGIHRLTTLPAAEHRAYFEALLGGAEESGPAGGGEDGGAKWLCVLATAPASSALAVARRGSVHVGPVNFVEGKVSDFRPGPAATPRSAVDHLLATLSATEALGV